MIEEAKTMESKEQKTAKIEEEEKVREQLLLDAFWDKMLMESSELPVG